MRPIHRAAIIAVGSEMLTPSKVDTNSLFITEQLNLLGIEVTFKTIVGDDRAELEHVVRDAIARVDLLVCCGGLGPTDDDLTRPVVAGVMERPLIEDETIASRIRARFQGRGLEMPEINRRQAMVPTGGRVIPNPNGTAPGLWIEDGDRVVLLLPGPPRELKPMMATLAESPLRERAGGGMALVRRIIRITGRSESHVDEAMQPLYAEWSRAAVPMSATILASLGQIELHLTACCAARFDAEHALNAAVEQVKDVMGLHVYSTDGRAMEEVLGEMLAERKLWIAVAESCTGGLIASRLTDVPGSSRYVERGIVSYSNAAKTELLGVSKEMLMTHGAVSEPVAIAMAEGIRGRARTDIGVGVTGVAGPDGGTPEKPVGMVCIAAASVKETRVRTFRFVGGREMVKFQASQAALDMVRRMLLEAN
ncbi:MAG: competence/damage-inducible protein A [Acidobacteria bacterium]|nr:MAG: competence/damage-inducible protein A [Acidobacteriota bacterium]